MKKIIWAVIWCALFYLAAYMRLEGILAFVLVSGMMAVILFAASCYLTSVVRISFRFPQEEGQKGEGIHVVVCIQNPSFLPISRFALHICYSYDGSGAEKEGILQGMVPAKSSAEMELILLPRYCGVVTVSANALDIWDLLGIFCRHVRELGSQKTVLLPSNLSMRLDTVRLKTDMISLLEQEEQKGSGNIPPDVSQIHPYQEGEPLRFVHWKLTARTDELMSRQFSEETQPLPVLFLDRWREEEMDLLQMDAFWEIAAACSRGFINSDITHEIMWYADGDFYRREVSHASQCLLAMKEAMLYGRECRDQKQRSEVLDRMYQIVGSGVPVIILEQSLAIVRDGVKTAQFSKDSYREEIEKRWTSV